jgi:adenine-specific DNA-methyltransferase
MVNKQKLELTWIGKENCPRLEPRILLEDPARSYHAAHRVTERDCFDNRLIFGDNLLALKALEAEFAGKVKCVFITTLLPSTNRLILLYLSRQPR